MHAVAYRGSRRSWILWSWSSSQPRASFSPLRGEVISVSLLLRKDFQLGNRMPAGKMSITLEPEVEFAELVLNVGAITVGEKNRKKMKNSQLRKKESEVVSRAVCALLNSGGGVVVAKIKNQNYNLIRDGIGLDLETSFGKMLPVVPNYLDYMKHKDYMSVFVKAWVLGVSGQHLITLKTNLYLRDLSLSNEKKVADTLQFLRLKREQGVFLDSKGRLSGKFACDEFQKSPASFFNKAKLTYKDEFPLAKSSQLEITLCPKEKIEEHIIESLPKSVSAFANTDGGYLFFGIDGKKQQIIGFEAQESDLVHLESEIEKCIQQLPVYHFCEEKEKIQYSCRFIEVARPGDVCSYVCALRVERFCCAVFAKEPDSWHVEDNCVKLFTLEDWVKLQMEATPAVSTKPVCIPESLCMEFSQHKGLEQLIQEEMGPLHQRLVIFSKSRSLDLGFQEIKGSVCTVFHISESSLPTLYYVVRMVGRLEGEFTVLRDGLAKLKDHSKQTTLSLKHKLVSLGGYTEKIGIVIKILYLHHNGMLLYDSNSKIRYPSTYYLTPITLGRLQKAADTVLSSLSL